MSKVECLRLLERKSHGMHAKCYESLKGESYHLDEGASKTGLSIYR